MLDFHLSINPFEQWVVVLRTAHCVFLNCACSFNLCLKLIFASPCVIYVTENDTKNVFSHSYNHKRGSC